MIVFAIYALIFITSFVVVKTLARKAMTDYTALKTVTFGDESAVRPNRIASVISVLTIFLLWGAFTGSKLVPSMLHAPGPFMGDASFNYTAEAEGVAPDDATVTVRVFEVGTDVQPPEIAPGSGWAKNDVDTVGAWRSGLIRVDKNDEYGRDVGHTVTAVNGQPIAPGGEVMTEFGRVGMSPKGTLNFEPAKGWQMEPIWLPPPEAVVARLVEIANEGYRDSTLWEHLGWSLFRVIVGFFFGALVGIPLGYAMGLSDWFRGWFDPIVEFMRPVPPLALIPLVIIWAGIGELGKIILLFLAALWIMAIAARAGVSGVAISKVHAAYSLGASKWQIMRHVIVPNSLPEIFTGARVAMGVCWGTVVAAELVAAEKGAGMMIMVASKFQLTDIVIMGIILIGLIGFGIDILMRLAEKALVPWKGRI
ncbi:ABC transporter permease subunit [Tropicibacter naphthalenivorans]|uniref:Putative aliphatic sulfonates transport permease protein SsuC n=1 Tax=Tropicibacter naphthalenivorans TaxID=441103 RepID=A0A0P1G981_9RHOB|nr:ABC transporter permease subunit [Tropicibacter naphthalenivorans]CUH78027.1 Putative aliphatic sulfonates transport permease protein SsuC [Tropicibacter naphthalenivorans]SMC94125.1 taurine transport system permease protein [Tropicibacter naphthalenivorans]